MQTVGIICEYNPIHLGHQKQFRLIRDALGSECGIVCLMSGNYVQRGAPAIFDMELRAKAAILSGADLVLELPVTHVLSSAEGFASGGVRILSQLCDILSFGAEDAQKDALLRTAEALLSPAFSSRLKDTLSLGLSFPAARQAALQDMGFSADLLSRPNNILAVEYCKAILTQNAPMDPFPIFRNGNYHALTPDSENPSATFLRSQICKGKAWSDYIPSEARQCFAGADIHALEYGERAILARLRTMDDTEFEALPFGSEGLWRKLMHAVRSQPTLEAILAETKSKRYTRTRLDRMIFCAFLGIQSQDLEITPPYTRVLAFNERGRVILKKAKQSASFINAGEQSDTLYYSLERRCSDLYGLFSVNEPGAPGGLSRQRIYYQKSEE